MDEPENLTDSPPEVEETKDKSPIKWGRTGKIFLLAGIVLVQAAAAYSIVGSYYPDFRSFASQLQSSNSVYYKFENIIINPAGTNGERYLILTISVELNSESALSVLDRKKPEVRDRINTAISQHTAAELSSLKNRKKIKSEVGEAINNVIGKKSVRNLFFTKYVLQ